MASDDKKLEGEFVITPSQTPKREVLESQEEAEIQDKNDPELQKVEEKQSSEPIILAKPSTKNTPDHKHRHYEPAALKIGMHKNAHFYSSLSYYPEGIGFESQESDEEIILLIRRDFITNLPWILVAIFFSILPLIIIPFLPVIAPFVDFTQTTITLYTMFYYLALLGYIIVNFTLWYFQVGIVTNKHVIDIDVHGILSRDVARTQLRNVEDVKYTQVGVVRSIFNYGDVHIQTAGTNSNFEFDRVPEPSLIIQIIQDLVGKNDPS